MDILQYFTIDCSWICSLWLCGLNATCVIGVKMMMEVTVPIYLYDNQAGTSDEVQGDDTRETTINCISGGLGHDVSFKPYEKLEQLYHQLNLHISKTGETPTSLQNLI